MRKLGMALLLLLAACQTSSGGFAVGECEAKGHGKGTAAFQACEKAIYAREERRAMTGCCGP